MTSVKILVIEDELIIAEDMRMMLESLGYDVVGIALDYSEAMELLERSSPDIVLTDIALGGAKDGIDLAREIRERYDLPFVFITSHADKSTLDRAKSQRPNGYLVKPFEAEDLYTCIEVALANYGGISLSANGVSSESILVRDSIYVKEGHLLVKVEIGHLRWIKSDGNYLELHTESKRHVIRSSMKEFMDKLPENQFFRTHKSYAVNLYRIDAINNAAVVLGEDTVPIGRNFRELLLKQLNTA